MLAFDRSWLSRPLLLALGCGSLLGFGGCGGAATGELGDEMDGEGGDSGRTGSVGGSGGVPGGFGGTGGRGSTGGRGGTGGSSGGVAGFSGNAGSFSTGGDAGFGGSTGFAGSAGAAGVAGTSSMPEPSVCVDLSLGLAGLPSQAFPAEEAMVNEYCGLSIAEGGLTFQAICLPAPGNGQSCTSFYPAYIVNELYDCGRQSAASYLCGPHEPLPDTNGCRGDECCYVLVGDCP